MSVKVITHFWPKKGHMKQCHSMLESNMMEEAKKLGLKNPQVLDQEGCDHIIGMGEWNTKADADKFAETFNKQVDELMEHLEKPPSREYYH